MKKLVLLLTSVIVLISCSDANENTMFVKGTIKGLKKGTLYLQKKIDSVTVSVDSVSVNGTDSFLLTDEVLSPEMYYLTLGKTDKKITFFGEKDSITITSKLDNFVIDAKIQGSQNQDLLDQFREMEIQFNHQNLDLIKEEFEAHQANSQDSLQLVTTKQKNLIRRKYLYTTNFAVNNGNSEVAPYLALTALPNGTFKLLDTINKSLSPEVKASKYGKDLEKHLAKYNKN